MLVRLQYVCTCVSDGELRSSSSRVSYTVIISVGIPSGIPYGIPKIDGIPFGIPNGTWYLGFPFLGVYLRYEDGMDDHLPISCTDC